MGKRRTSASASKRSAPVSAGILLYRHAPQGLRLLLAHPGGPFFAKKDAGSWTIPKGLIGHDEEPAHAARREFEEELGWRPDGELEPLGEVQLASGKRVIAFAVRSTEVEEEILARFTPGKFTMEWPPKSGRVAEFPEVDRIEFFSLETAREKLNAAQGELLGRVVDLIRRIDG